jgi:hypothetical protein
MQRNEQERSQAALDKVKAAEALLDAARAKRQHAQNDYQASQKEYDAAVRAAQPPCEQAKITRWGQVAVQLTNDRRKLASAEAEERRARKEMEQAKRELERELREESESPESAETF